MKTLLKILALYLFLLTNSYALIPKQVEYQASCPWRPSFVSSWSTSVESICTGGFGASCAQFQGASTNSAQMFGISCYAVNSTGGMLGQIYTNERFACPANSHESSLTCACDAGYVEGPDGMSCVKEEVPDPCEQGSGLANHCSALQGSKQFWTKSDKRSGAWTCRAASAVMGQELFPGCTKGCMGENVGISTSFQNDAGQWITNGQARMTGATCDPSVVEDLNGESDSGYEKDPTPAPTPEPDKSCPNGFKGQVNGVDVCLPPKASSGITELEEKDNGDGTKTSTKTEVKCENGKCEITKTSTTTNTTTNTTVSSSSVTTTVDKADYCSKNKTAGACKDEQGDNTDGNGKFGGSCEGGFTCEGDAVMCAMAKEQHKRACETLEPAKDGIWKQIEEGTDSGSAEAMKSEASTINISTQLDTSGYGLPRSCPADPVIELPFVSKTFTIPFSKACPILKTMSDVALLITALSLLVWLVAPRGKAE